MGGWGRGALWHACQHTRPDNTSSPTVTKHCPPQPRQQRWERTPAKTRDLCKTRKMTHLICKRIWSVRKVYNCMIYLLNAGENNCFDDKAWVWIGRELSSLSHRVRTGGFPNASSMLCHRAGCHFSSEWERRTSARFSFQRVPIEDEDGGDGADETVKHLIQLKLFSRR